MIDKLLTSSNMGLFHKALDAATMRNEAIANNLANIDTPKYKRFDVTFEEEVRKALGADGGIKGRTTNPRHISIGRSEIDEVRPKLVRDEHTVMRNDGNNVDIDKENAALAKNQLMYQFLVDSIKGEFQKIKLAITGRG